MIETNTQQKSAPTGIRMGVAGVCVLLAAMVWLVYGQTLGFGFVNYDDNAYVYENPVVSKGVTLQGIKWALTYGGIGHWHPLTWLSHMLDCQLYGLRPRGHHLTNVLFHSASAILLFLALRQMTGAHRRSAFVAAVFAVHPLHVESVAWISERKDVLSGFFFMLTLLAYTGYARRPFSLFRYFAVIALFAAGLMCKGMLVTLPFVLMLLDYWPLGRWKPDVRDGGFSRLLIEKIPLFALSAASCVITSLAPEKLAASENMPFLLRLENGAVSCGVYLRQTVWPSGLAVPYPDPADYFSWWEALAVLTLLVAITLCACLSWKKRPWLAVGWLWYLGMLVPVSGIVQVSDYAHADRYTYLPQLGLCLLLAWSATDLAAGLPYRRPVLDGCSAIAVGVLLICARAQAAYWKSDEALWHRALAVTTGNAIAHNNLGGDLLQAGDPDEAIAQFHEALNINPGYAEAHANLGSAFLQKGLGNAASTEYEKALEIDPGLESAHYNFGNILMRAGRLDDAITHYQAALEINPDDAATLSNLGYALLLKGRLDDAKEDFERALEINPGFADAHGNLGTILLHEGRAEEAVTHFEKAIAINPDYITALNNLAYLRAASPRASLRDGAKAVELAQRASAASGGNNPVVLGTLAAAYAEDGLFSKAIETAQAGMDLANSQSDTARASVLQSQITRYKAGMPLRDESLGN